MAPKIYYNEIEPYAVEYMRWLMAGGLIAYGEIDTRSIEDVAPDDLRGYAQCHFFAGMGVWSYALRRARWPDDRRIWTGSCPCQPFSASGQGLGFADERHLWPAFFHLITNCRPQRVVGEQVTSRDGLAWLDLVSSDLEGADYAFRAAPICSAGFGSPDIRNRLYWVGDAFGERPEIPIFQRGSCPTPNSVGQASVARVSGCTCGLADGDDAERGPDASGGHVSDRADAGWPQGSGDVERRGCACGVADTASGGVGPGLCRCGSAGHRRFQPPDGRQLGGLANAHGGVQGDGDLQRSGQHGQQPENGPLARASGGAGPLNGFWRDADWLRCRDGRWRPVEPGTFPLDYGVAARMGRLRATGNAINAEAAREFIKALD